MDPPLQPPPHRSHHGTVCDICDRRPSKYLSFKCSACARGALYPHRIDHVQLLLERERLRKLVEAVHTGDSSKGQELPGATIAQAHGKLQFEKQGAEIYDSKDRIDDIIKKAALLRSNIEEYKKAIQDKQDELAKRKQVKEQLALQYKTQRIADMDALRKVVRKSRVTYERLASRLHVSRAILCKEIAVKAGMRMDKDRGTVLLAGNSIPDLRDLNNFSHAHISASFTQITLLLALVCDYLNVRLPAEITVPSQDWSCPTILPPSSSHQDLVASFPRSSSGLSPTLTRSKPSTLDSSPPTAASSSRSRPRPLFVDRKLPVLAREDAPQYLHFLEGAALLAWDIAWLCRSQGLLIAELGDWEEMTCIGKNLWALLMDQTRKDIETHRSGPRRRQSTQSSRTEMLPAEGTKPRPNTHSSSERPRGSARTVSTTSTTSTTAAATSKLNPGRTLPLPSNNTAWAFHQPLKLRDLLRQHLLADMQGAEWEVLDDGEAVRDQMDAEERDRRLAEGPERTNDGPVVLVGKAKKGRAKEDGGEASMQSQDGAHNEEGEDILAQTAYVDETEERRVNAWTKVKSRAPL